MTAVRWALRSVHHPGVSSWHVTRPDDPDTTLCGRHVRANAEVRLELPGDEKTCERCAALATRIEPAVAPI